MTRIASVYAEALYGLTRDEGLCDEVLGQLEVLRAAFEAEPDFLRLLSAPSLSKEERLHIVEESFAGRVHPYLLNFMKILTQKGYMRCFTDCCAAYRDLYNEDNGILPVKVVTAVPLRQAQSNRLQSKLNAMTGKQVRLENVIEPDCLGGVRLEYDGKRVDDTIRHRLDAVHSMLKNTIL